MRQITRAKLRCIVYMRSLRFSLPFFCAACRAALKQRGSNIKKVLFRTFQPKAIPCLERKGAGRDEQLISDPLESLEFARKFAVCRVVDSPGLL